MRNIILTLLTACCMNLTQAGVSIDGTRIIFPASSTSVGVQVRNEFSTPALVQTWIDNGNMNEIPPAEEIPFVISPPLSRVEPHQGQIIRVIQTGSPELPEDRESLFWFNLLDVPPDNPNLSTQNLLSFTVRTRIKMFYRPAKLKMSINEAYNQIHFKYLNDEQKLEVNNPTPITLLSSILTLNHRPMKKRINSLSCLSLTQIKNSVILNLSVPLKKLITQF